MDTPINPGDQIVAIAEDDDTIRLSGVKPSIDESMIRPKAALKPVPRRTLILGWTEEVSEIVEQLDAYVAEGSSVTLVSDKVGDGESLRIAAASCATSERAANVGRLDQPCGSGRA